MPNKIDTTELDKMLAVRDKSQAIGDFLSWLNEKYDVALPRSIEELLADFFDIDLAQAERERAALLDDLREGYNEQAADFYDAQQEANTARKTNN